MYVDIQLNTSVKRHTAWLKKNVCELYSAQFGCIYFLCQEDGYLEESDICLVLSIFANQLEDISRASALAMPLGASSPKPNAVSPESNAVPVRHSEHDCWPHLWQDDNMAILSIFRVEPSCIYFTTMRFQSRKFLTVRWLGPGFFSILRGIAKILVLSR